VHSSSHQQSKSNHGHIFTCSTLLIRHTKHQGHNMESAIVHFSSGWTTSGSAFYLHLQGVPPLENQYDDCHCSNMSTPLFLCFMSTEDHINQVIILMLLPEQIIEQECYSKDSWGFPNPYIDDKQMSILHNLLSWTSQWIWISAAVHWVQFCYSIPLNIVDQLRTVFHCREVSYIKWWTVAQFER
jgi:hypothetical protein